MGRFDRLDEKKKTIICCCLSALLSALIFTCSNYFSGMFPGKEVSFLNGDGFAQALCFSKMLYRHLLNGDSITWSFEVGMGMPTMAIYAFYAFSPFNCLVVFIKDIEMAAFCIVLAKLMMSAVTMCVLLRKAIVTDTYSSIFLAVSYSLCAFFQSFYLAYYFLDMLWLMPLLVYALKHFVDTGKWYLLCFIYSLSFVIQFYCAYIMGVFSVLLLLAYCTYSYGKDGKRWKSCLIRYTGCVVMAGMISAPVTLPAAMELFSYRTDEELQFQSHVLHILDFLAGFFPAQGQGRNNRIPQMYVGLPVFILVIRFIFRKGIKRIYKLAAVLPCAFLAVAMFVDPLYRMMHAFDAPNSYYYRFSWEMSFCMICLAAMELKISVNEKHNTRKAALIGGCVLAMGAIIFAMRHYLADKTVQTTNIVQELTFGCLIVLYIIIDNVITKKQRKNLFCLILVIAELAYGLILNRVRDNFGSLTAEYSRIWQQQVNALNDYIYSNENKDDEAFFRVRHFNSTADNLSAMYGYKGIGWFSSIENGRVRKLLQQLGYAASPLVVHDYGATSVTQMLFSQKYYLECGYYSGENRDKYMLGSNDKVLPLGYMVSDKIDSYDAFESNDAFENINRLVSAMCGKKHNVFCAHEGAVMLQEDGLEHVFMDGGIRVEKRVDGDTIGRYYLVPERDGRIYAYMSRWGASLDAVEKELLPRLYSEIDIGGMMELSKVTKPHIIQLGENEKGEYNLYLLMPENSVQAFDYEALYISYEDVEEITTVYSELKNGRACVSTANNREIMASVNVRADRDILFTSIPYDRHWKAWIDGESVDIQPVLNDAFIGLKLNEGMHEVRFEYHNPYVGIGITVCICALLMLFSGYIISLMNYKKLLERER